MSRTVPGVAMIVVALALVGAACSGSVASTGGTAVSVPQQLTPGDPLAGAPLYRGVCATCHGADLGGVEGLGTALLPSPLVSSTSDDDLTLLIINGRPADDPDTVTGVAMVPRGGSPWLTDQDIANIVAYLKGQQ